MNTFEIVAWVFGRERKIIVTEPLSWNASEFELNFDQAVKKNNLTIKLENGHWLPLLPLNINSNTVIPQQLEIDSIGYQIAKHWCSRLEQQLAEFQICI